MGSSTEARRGSLGGERTEDILREWSATGGGGRLWKARRPGLRQRRAEPEDILPAARPEDKETRALVHA